jgi:hypothetical protein
MFYRVVLTNNKIEEFLKELFKSNKKSSSPKEIMESCVALIFSFLISHYGFELNVMDYFVSNYFEMCCNNEFTEDERLRLLFFSIQEKYEFISNTIEEVSFNQYDVFDYKASYMNDICSFIKENYSVEHNAEFKYLLLNFIKDILIDFCIMYNVLQIGFNTRDHNKYLSLIREKLNVPNYYFTIDDDYTGRINDATEYVYALYKNERNTEISNFVRQKLMDINILDVKKKELEESHIYIFFSSNFFKATSLEDLKHLIIKHIVNFTVIGFIKMVFEDNNLNIINFRDVIIFQVLNKYVMNESLTREDMYNIAQEIISLSDYYKDMI